MKLLPGIEFHSSLDVHNDTLEDYKPVFFVNYLCFSLSNVSS